MKNRTVYAACSLLVLSMFGCDPSGAGSSQKSQKTIEIGAALPLSGTIAYYGESSRNGMEIALTEINDGGGIDGVALDVVYEDTRGTARDAINAMRKLVDLHGSQAVIGAGSSTETLAIVSIAQQNEVVLISPVSSSAAISDAGEFVFRSVPSDRQQAIMLAELVLANNADNIGLLFVNSSWGTGLKDEFAEAYRDRGGTIQAVESSELDDSDFRTQLLNITRNGPDALVAISYAREGGRIVRQARELGIEHQFFGADPWTIRDFLEIAGDAAEGVMYTTPGRYNGSEFHEFRNKYLDLYGHEPDVYAAHGYDCLHLIANALRSGARSGPDIRDFLSGVEDHRGASGTTTFDENGDVRSKPFVRILIRDGQAMPVSQP